MHFNITGLPERFAVIDKDTGTVLGTNVVVVPMPADADEQESLLSNDNDAVDYAKAHGRPLYAFVMDGDLNE